MANFEAYGYIRCSGLGQMDKDGPVRQRQAIEDHCAKRAITIKAFFQEAYTGSDLDGRKGFQEMRALMIEEGVGIVVCEKLDRIARDIIIQESMIADFRKNNITLISATPGEEDLCSKDPTRVLIRQIMGAFFEYERKMIVAKTRAARERLRTKNGRCEGRKPYGSRPGEKETLDLMLQYHKIGYPADQIAHFLNVHQNLSRMGKTWNGGTVYRIIHRHFKAQSTPV